MLEETENKTQSLSLSLSPFHNLTKWSSTFIKYFLIFLIKQKNGPHLHN